uniref:Uncharacterized protein n=1 Tax=viral metagenome TaxID=1070528 RepID=A0A6M3LJF4_9ZZZZ
MVQHGSIEKGNGAGFTRQDSGRNGGSMAQNLKIEINIIHSLPGTNIKEFDGIITRSRNEAILN